MRRTLLTLLLILIGAPSHAQAPFSRLDFSVRAVQNVNRSALHEYWQPAKGIQVSIATPFYAGDWEVHLGVHRFNASADVPGFGALRISSGWGLRIPLRYGIALRPAVTLGNYRMSFDDSGTRYSGESSESDFVGSLGVMLTYTVGKTWYVFGQSEYLRIQTQPLMHLWFVSAGIGIQVPSGKLVQTLLE